MQIHELLIGRKKEIEEQLTALQSEAAEIDRILSAARIQPVNTSAQVNTVGMTKDDAIIHALKAGARTPAQIADFIRQQLGMEVNPASTHTRLSRMKADGKIKHDGVGWSL